jgi:uncharacterized protein (UPF0332 family)
VGDRVSLRIRRLLDERRLVRIRVNRNLIVKEMQGANYDLERARESLEEEDFKWATVQAYYAMFHSARALLYSQGYREKSHRALLTAIREIFLRSGELGNDLIEDFSNAMDLREEADYGMTFSETGAEEVVEKARNFMQRVKEILKI